MTIAAPQSRSVGRLRTTGRTKRPLLAADTLLPGPPSRRAEKRAAAIKTRSSLLRPRLSPIRLCLTGAATVSSTARRRHRAAKAETLSIIACWRLSLDPRHRSFERLIIASHPRTGRAMEPLMLTRLRCPTLYLARTLIGVPQSHDGFRLIFE
jgi:hypothetical protein